MKAAVISDIHDHIGNLREVLTHSAARECDVMLCCGDICSPFMIDVIHEHWQRPFHLVFGNNDGDRFLISRKVSEANERRNERERIIIHGEYLFKHRGAALTGLPGDSVIAMTHYPEIARQLETEGDSKMICFGHSHIPEIRLSGDCLLVNPGSVMGYIPSEKSFVSPSFVVADIHTLKAELFQV